MAMSVNTNVVSLNAQRNLGTSQSSLATSMQRLSSGLRVNSAKDDAAGLAISERMNAQVRGLNVAARNANDGISLAQTAEGALGKIGDMLQRIRELAVQSANATNSGDDRTALQAEVAQLKEEIGRVAEQTTFNGTKLLNGSFTAGAFQVGANQGETISLSEIANASLSALGSWTSVGTPATATGVAPVGSGGSGATPATAALGAFTAGVGGAATDDVTFTFTATGGDTFSVSATGATPSAANIAAEFVTAGFAADGSGTVNGFTLDLGAETTITAAITNGTLTVQRADGDNFTSAVATSDGSGGAAGYSTSPTFAGLGTTSDGVAATAGTLGALTGAAFTINGTNVEVGPAADAATRLSDLVAAINGNVTGVTASVVGGALQLSSASNITVGGSGAVTAETGLTAGPYNIVAGTAQTGFAGLDVSTVAGANNAMLAMDAAIKDVNSARGTLGAVQSRFENAIANIQTTAENLTAARGRIVDADFAQETSNLSRSQILQQAGTAMVAQANQLPQQVLSLLR